MRYIDNKVSVDQLVNFSLNITQTFTDSNNGITLEAIKHRKGKWKEDSVSSSSLPSRVK